MANDYIIITRTNRPQLGSQIIAAANRLKELRELVRGLADVAGHMHDGATYTTLEAQFGIPAGSGANFVTLLGLLDNILNTNTTVAGTDRLSQLNEFVGRLAGQ